MATIKKPGPPVPPRPQHTNATASLLKAQRESFVNSFNRSAATTASPTKSPTTPPAPTSNAKSTVATEPSVTSASTAAQAPPVLGKKPSLPANGVGRTVIYKSPSMTMQNKPQITARGTPAPKPPLKARKAPDVPTTVKPRVNGENCETAQANAVNLNRHHSMGAAKTAGSCLKDAPPRLSLGRADFEKVSHKLHMDQLQPALMPLPKPRKIVQMPVATLDLDDDDDDRGSTTTTTGSSTFYTSTPLSAATPTSTSTATSGMKIFRRSKTTLDSLASRVSVTTIASNGSSGGSSNGGSFLGGKTVELKNNLKNAAERLFSELIVSQQKHHHNHHAANNSSTSSSENGQGTLMITKHERAIQHQAVVDQQKENDKLKLQQQQQIENATHKTVSAVAAVGEVGGDHKSAGASSESLNNCTTRININSTSLSSEIENVLKSPEKKTAFHEILISELAAMRAKSSSMENLQTKDVTRIALNAKPPQSELVESAERNANEMQPTTRKAGISTKNTTTTIATLKKFPIRSRCNSLEDQDDPDTEDADADNIDDIEADVDDLRKSLKVVVASAKGTPRKRTPSGCSSDSSPYGTERSARIRTSDWIEVGDNGKQVTLTSCHISLEDSGLEDEERMDDMSSSGVGDSWDSVKEAAQHEKRSRTNVKRVMSITELPPLPKSLSGFNKMLGSDSGLLSDADASFECNNNSNTNNSSSSSDNVLSKLECQKEQNNAENNNNNNHNDNGASTSTMATASPESPPDNISTSSSSEATTTTAIGAAATTLTTTPTTTATANSPGCTLNAQLALLKKEMYGLRQLDLSLLSQLWTLNDSIQEFRNMIQENEEVEDDNEDDDDDDDDGDGDDDPDEREDDDVVSYPRPSRSTSSYDPESSEGDEDIHHMITNNNNNNSPNIVHLNMKKNLGATPKIITTQPKLRKTNSSEYLNESPPSSSSIHHLRPSSITLRPSVDMKPVPRMRSAPPPPPSQHLYRKAAAPPRPT